MKMLYSNTVTFYEHHNGILMNGNLVLPYNDNMWRYQDMIFDILPNTEVESFSYTSTYVDGIHFNCFKSFPKTLKIIELAHWRGVEKYVIEKLIAQGVECHHQYEIPFSECEVPIYDDSKTYKLEGGRWKKMFSDRMSQNFRRWSDPGRSVLLPLEREPRPDIGVSRCIQNLKMAGF